MSESIMSGEIRCFCLQKKMRWKIIVCKLQWNLVGWCFLAEKNLRNDWQWFL